MSPFSPTAETSVAAIGESELIARIGRWLGEASPPPPGGMGDDCAVLPRLPGKPLVTVDPVVYGRHFDDSVAPEAAGAKLLKRNLSDIAAMGGTPHTAVLALTLSPDMAVAWLERFIQGLGKACIHFSMTLAGGDVTGAPGQHFGAGLTLIGWAEQAVTRLGGDIGDYVCVTGSLGGSGLGKHAAFAPRLEEGRWLAGRPEVMAMMDVTDGLAKDLPAMLPENACAKIDTATVPLSGEASTLAATSGKPPLEHACCDGEDYELLVMVDGQADIDAFLVFFAAQFDTALTCIGQIAKASSTKHARKLIDAGTGQLIYPGGGYQHFVKESRK